MTVLFNYQPSEHERDAIAALCTRAVQSGKRIAIFKRPADLRDMTIQELQAARFSVGIDRSEASCKLPALMFAFRLFERMLASRLTGQAANAKHVTAEITDEVSVSTEFSRDDLQHFLNKLQPNPARLQEFGE